MTDHVPDDVVRYAWADATDPDVEALAVTLVRPAFEGLAGAPRVMSEYPNPMTVAEGMAAIVAIDDFAWGSELLQLDELDGWSVLIQPAGWGIAMPEVVAELSRQGEAIAVFWNVNALMTFSLARGGDLVRTFDPLLYDDPDPRLAEESDLPFGDDEHPLAASFALAERLSGVRIEREWLFSRARRTFRVAIPR